MKRLAPIALVALLAGCAAPPVATTRGVGLDPVALPQMKMFTGRPDQPLRASNSVLARDFLDLTFSLETGRPLGVLSRFEGPITYRVLGTPPATLEPDLEGLVQRIWTEAGIGLTRVGADQPASITIETVTEGEIQRFAPTAACFVSPEVSSWRDFRSRQGGRVDWADITVRRQLAIFVPADVSPQELRDCLHEELAQAIGPLNDLYRLPNSVFNDDNFRAALTGFDMMMLRLTYAPEFLAGMTADEVAARLPAVLARLNPTGGAVSITPPEPTDRPWTDLMNLALDPHQPGPVRRANAGRAVQMSADLGWTDSRRAFALYVYGRLALGTDPQGALDAFLMARQIYDESAETDIQSAHVALQLAAFALHGGKSEAVLALVNGALPAAMRAQNAALLAQLLFMKAEALDLAGRGAEAQVVRLDSLGWARYGFGSQAEIADRLAEIKALTPKQLEASNR
jgi:hypothetical protein